MSDLHGETDESDPGESIPIVSHRFSAENWRRDQALFARQV
ncbi:MAG: hypothetical protein VYE64_12000 [Planctomycetota bacterium]|nr:hypothetical protein [Planctomycetota bacterium]